jgi:hypothetical protein
VFPLRYELSVYTLLRRSSVFRGLMDVTYMDMTVDGFWTDDRVYWTL